MNSKSETPQVIELKPLNDMHVHFRQGIDSLLAKIHEKYSANVMIMPNTVPAVSNEALLDSYVKHITSIVKPSSMGLWFTLYLKDSVTPDLLKTVKDKILAVKVYPDGVTTNSGSGIRNLLDFDDTLKAMEEMNIVLSIHGEKPGEFVMDRERLFLEQVGKVLLRFPKLRVVLEHITTTDAANFVEYNHSRNIAATITPHHLLLTLDDVIGDKLQPRNFCKPIAKTPADREVLRQCAVSKHRFFLGSDSAPHVHENKFCDGGCAGVFTAPILPRLITDIFFSMDSMETLNAFVHDRAESFYGLPKSSKPPILLKRSTTNFKPDFVSVTSETGSSRRFPFFKYVPFHNYLTQETFDDYCIANQEFTFSPYSGVV